MLHKWRFCGSDHVFHHSAGSSVQRMTGCTCRITPEKKIKKAWREGQMCRVVWESIYLHRGLPLRKTHPDTPRWEEEEEENVAEKDRERRRRWWRKVPGVQMMGRRGVHSPKPRVEEDHNTAKHRREDRKREEDREKVVISHPCSMQRKQLPSKRHKCS